MSSRVLLPIGAPIDVKWSEQALSTCCGPVSSSEIQLAAIGGRRYVRPVAIETLVGTTLAGYTVRGKVGEGGTSTVFRAEHAQHGTVVLKVLRENCSMTRRRLRVSCVKRSSAHEWNTPTSCGP